MLSGRRAGCFLLKQTKADPSPHVDRDDVVGTFFHQLAKL
jgi:hypothetical protein